jgi:hypothetical protein
MAHMRRHPMLLPQGTGADPHDVRVDEADPLHDLFVHFCGRGPERRKMITHYRQTQETFLEPTLYRTESLLYFNRAERPAENVGLACFESSSRVIIAQAIAASYARINIS